METRFESFIRERQYLSNVSHRTVQRYRELFKWLGTPPTDERTLKAFVIKMRAAGLKPSSCNNRISAVNAFLKWSGSPLKASRLKEEERVLPTFKHTVQWTPILRGAVDNAVNLAR